MALQLSPGEALILFIRRSPDNPARYMAAIRTCETELDARKDIHLSSFQRTISETGRQFDSLQAALDAGVHDLQKVASGVLPL
jgi:hypothetical protein